MIGTLKNPLRHRPRPISMGYGGWGNCGVRADQYNTIVTPRLKNANCPDCLRLQKEFAERSKKQLADIMSKPKNGPLRKPVDNDWVARAIRKGAR